MSLALEILREIKTGQPLRKGPTITKCSNGHPWTPESTYHHPQGWKVCRICTKGSLSHYRSRRKAAAA